MTKAIKTDIRVIIIDTELNKVVYVFLYDYFREYCFSTGQVFSKFCNDYFKQLCEQFKVSEVIESSEAELRLGIV